MPRSASSAAAVAITACISALVTTVEAGAKGAGDAVGGQLRVADRDLAVQHDVAVVLEEGPRRCRELVSVAYATEVTPMTFSPSARAFMAISTGRALRPDSEMTTSTSPALRRVVSSTAPASPSTRSRALPRVAGMTSTPTTPGHGQQVHQGEAARAVDDVLGGERGVPGAEGEEPAAGGDGVGEQVAGRRDALRLLVPHPPQQADRGVEELPGQRALAHRRGPSAVSGRPWRGSPCGLDQCRCQYGAAVRLRTLPRSGRSRRGRLSAAMRQN